jgi:hypothetical protein
VTIRCRDRALLREAHRRGNALRDRQGSQAGDCFVATLFAMTPDRDDTLDVTTHLSSNTLTCFAIAHRCNDG